MLKRIKQTLPDLPDGQNIAIALSGGLDSTVLVYLLVNKYGKNNIKAISFDFGQRHSIELEMAQKTVSILDIEHTIIKLDYLAEISRNSSSLIANSELEPFTAEENSGNPQVNTYVPFRNAQFAFITAAFAETNHCRYIAQGLNAVDEYGYWDTSIEFTHQINNILLLNRENQITFISPFIEMYKDEELLLAKELNKLFNIDILKNTWSCYNGKSYNNKECGVCNTCCEKLRGYIDANYDEEIILNKFNIDKDKLKKLKES